MVQRVAWAASSRFLSPTCSTVVCMLCATLCLEPGSIDLGPAVLRRVQFTPTIDHCSLATLIGLCIRTQLIRKLPETFKIDIMVRDPASQCW